MNKKIFGIFASLLVVAMLATPLIASVSAKPATYAVEFRVESWPNINDLGDWTTFPTGQEKFVIIKRLNCIGIPPLIDEESIDMPDDLLASRGGVRLIITGKGTYEGTVEQVIIFTQSDAATGDTRFSVEKWTFTFAEGTLEVSTTFRDGEGKCVGTRGTGLFEGAHFKGAYDITLTWFTAPGGNPSFKVAVGSGEIRLK